MKLFRNNSQLSRKDAEELMAKHSPLIPISIQPAKSSTASAILKHMKFVISPLARLETLNSIINQKYSAALDMKNISIYLFTKHGGNKFILNPGITIGELSMNESLKPHGWLELLYHDQQTF